MKTLTLTPSEIYHRKNKLWKAYCHFAEKVRRAFFPDTGGVSLFVHNWYRCNEKSNPQGAKLVDWVEDSTYARYKRLEAKLEADDVQREHQFGNHSKKRGGFDPLWCPLCHPEKAKSYGLALVGGKWIKV